MVVHFVSKQAGATVIQVPEKGPRAVIRFDRGKYKTSDKREIKRILQTSFGRRNVKLAPNQDMQAISDYLLSDSRSDVMTKQYLEDIPFEAWEEIMRVRDDVDASFPLVGIAMSTLEGQPVDDRIEAVIAKHKGEEPTETDEDTEEPQEGDSPDGDPKPPRVKVKAKTPDGETSEDYTAEEAVAAIENKDTDELQGFLHPKEKRVTVLRAWNEKFPEQAVDIKD